MVHFRAQLAEMFVKKGSTIIFQETHGFHGIYCVFDTKESPVISFQMSRPLRQRDGLCTLPLRFS